METLKRSLFGLSLLIVVSCGVHHDVLLNEGTTASTEGPNTESNENNPDEGKNTAPNANFLRGQFPTTDGNTIELSEHKDKPVVLVFAGQFCSTCVKEVGHFKDELNDPTVAPDKIYLFNVLIAAWPEDANWWKNQHQVPWTVGYDKEKTLFKQYCKGNTVPCTIIQTPANGIVFTHTGETSVADIQQHTGSWK